MVLLKALLLGLFFQFIASEADMVTDPKKFKALIKATPSVLAMFAEKTSDLAPKLVSEFNRAADEIRGRGSLVIIDCEANAKTCKKLREKPTGISIQHYASGKHSKTYTRPLKFQSFVNFMNAPDGDAPWSEDEAAADVMHIDDKSYSKFLKQSKKKPALLMFYAPWCGHCKKIKPFFSEAASSTKSEFIFAATDAQERGSMTLRRDFNITGFPTIKYFEKGVEKYEYGGERTTEGLIEWMRDPQPPAPPPPPEKTWAEEDESAIVHIDSEEAFDAVIASNVSTLTFFYAPWCGHCKTMKPKISEAADELAKDENFAGKILGIDATATSALAQRYEVSSYPTLFYFNEGEKQFKYEAGREKDDVINFMKDPKEPPPPPPPEVPWQESESAGDILHLTDANFAKKLKAKKNALIMFYAPWCGHCKNAKPELEDAAHQLKKDKKKLTIGAVDCTSEKGLAEQFGVEGFPTFLYFEKGELVEKYEEGRKTDDFVSYLERKYSQKEDL